MEGSYRTSHQDPAIKNVEFSVTPKNTSGWENVAGDECHYLRNGSSIIVLQKSPTESSPPTAQTLVKGGRIRVRPSGSKAPIIDYYAQLTEME
jgi:hypothetical protein